MALTKIGRLVDKGIIKDQTNLGTQAADTDEYLLYDADTDSLKSIAASNVTPNETLITGKTALGTGAASNDLILIYDTSTSSLKKVTQTNLLNFPVISSVSPTNALSGDGTGNHTFVITGTGFTGASANLVNTSGSNVSFDSVAVDSDTQITGVIAKSSLPGSGEPYDVKVTAGSGLTGTLDNQINIDQSPVFSTAAGSLGTIVDSARSSLSFTVAAADPESGGDVVYTLESGSLPAGLSLSSTSSGAVISGNATAVGSNTTSTFTIRAKDAASNTSDRQFTIQILAPATQSFTSSGTFSVPSGVTAVDVLVVGGGGAGGTHHGAGAGAGGLIYRPGFPVTPGGTVSVTVGDGGAATNNYPSPSPSGEKGASGQASVFGTLTAQGGGGGGYASNRGVTPGGSASGYSAPGGTNPGSGATLQTDQSGESGNYGFGNIGGGNDGDSAGGGGGAGGAGGNGQSSGPGGQGGIGRAYTIADGTTSVYYAGGGGGSRYPSDNPGGQGGQGGGGNGGKTNEDNYPSRGGTANRGGGGGAADRGPGTEGKGGGGGKGIVIVRY
jgi:hypothetical protein